MKSAGFFLSFFNKICFFLLIITGGFLFSVNSLFAYEIEKYDDKVEDLFLVSPSKLDLQLEPGQNLTESFQVINRLGRKQHFEIVVEGLIEAESGKEINSAKDWIRPEVDNFSLEQGEKIKMNFSVIVPEKVPSGGYYAAILVVARNPEQNKGNVDLISRVGVSLLASIPGEIKEKGDIIDLRTSRWFYWRGPVDFFSTFQNQGNIHLNLAGEISVYNFLGSQVAQLPLAEATVLPGAEKEWKTTWGKKWLLGFYPARLTFHYGQGNKVATEQLSFWAFPIDILLLVLFLLWLIHWIVDKFHWNLEIKRKRKNDKKERL